MKNAVLFRKPAVIKKFYTFLVFCYNRKVVTNTFCKLIKKCFDINEDGRFYPESLNT
jgi:hypothetical protein